MDDNRVLTVSGLYKNIKVICDFVANGARKSGLSDTDVFHIELACDEACTNIVEHAYGKDRKGDIRVQWELSPSQFIIKLHDNGRSFKPERVPKPPKQPIEPDNLKIGGLGLHFMKKLMDEVDFTFDDAGNTLTMKKNR